MYLKKFKELTGILYADSKDNKIIWNFRNRSYNIGLAYRSHHEILQHVQS